MKHLLLYFLLLICSATLSAQAPQMLNYQGVARSTNGAPLSNQSIKLRLSIQPANGNPFYVETHNVTTNQFGLYAVQIGQGAVVNGNFASISWAQNTTFLQVEMDPAGGNNFTLVGTPTQLISVPYSLEAQYAASTTLGGDVSGSSNANTVTAIQNRPVASAAPATGDVLKWNGSQWQPGTDAISGGGAYSAGSGISISGNVISNAGDLDNSNELQSISLSGNVLTLSDGGGSVTLPSGGGGGGTNYWQSFGGNDITNTNTGTVFLGGPAVPYQTIWASASNSSETAVFQQSGSGDAAFAQATSGTALSAQSTDGTALKATSYGNLPTIEITSNGSSSGLVIQGTGGYAASIGGNFERGLFVYSTIEGIYSYGGTTGATLQGGSKGVYAFAGNPSGYGGYFDGTVYAQTMQKGSGSFKIDHPLDPENKFLYHSFVESPDMMNMYNGNITTDSGGRAKIELPNYFEALNRDFRYQLTCIGTFAQVIVEREVSGNSFSIRSDKPNVKVSWQVTGIRKDAHADHFRIIPEVEKQQDEKGKYLCPECFGQPESKGMMYEERKRAEAGKNNR